MKFFSPKLMILAFAAVIALSVNAANAQNEPPPEEAKQQFAVPPEQRPNLLRELDLSREQIQQLRRLNQERNQLKKEAARRMREAKRDLDIAIYSDNFSEIDAAAKLKEFQIAQAEVAKIKFQDEMALRKILTPEQLSRFRQMKQRFEQTRENLQKNRRQKQIENQPLRRVDRLRRPLPNN